MLDAGCWMGAAGLEPLPLPLPCSGSGQHTATAAAAAVEVKVPPPSPRVQSPPAGVPLIIATGAPPADVTSSILCRAPSGHRRAAHNVKGGTRRAQPSTTRARSGRQEGRRRPGSAVCAIPAATARPRCPGDAGPPRRQARWTRRPLFSAARTRSSPAHNADWQARTPAPQLNAPRSQLWRSKPEHSSGLERGRRRPSSAVCIPPASSARPRCPGDAGPHRRQAGQTRRPMSSKPDRPDDSRFTSRLHGEPTTL
jgi:hypothetical protein